MSKYNDGDIFESQIEFAVSGNGLIKVDGKDKWVAVFGGGYNGAVNPNVGSAVFVIDLEDEGKVLKVININLNFKKLSSGVTSTQ